MKVLFFVSSGLALCASCGLGPKKVSTRQESFDRAAIKSIALDMPSAKVEVQATTAKEAVIRIKTFQGKMRLNRAECSPKVQQVEAALVIKAKERLGTDCDYEVVMEVDSLVNLDLSTGAGDVWVEGILSDAVRVHSRSGHIAVHHSSGAMDLSSGSGGIDVGDKQLSSKMTEDPFMAEVQDKLETGSGDIHYDLSYRVTRGAIRLETGSGDVHVALPDELSVSLSREQGSGKAEISGIHLTEGEGVALSVKTGSGDLTIAGKTLP